MALHPARLTHRPHPTGTPDGDSATRLIAAILVIGALYAAKRVMIPCALAVLLSFLLLPLARRFERWGLRRVPAVLLAVGLGLACFLGVGYLVTAQVGGLAGELPSYRQNIVNRIRRVRAALGGPFGEARETIQEIRNEIAAPTTAPTEDGSSPPAPANAAAQDIARAPSGPGGKGNALLSWPWPQDPFGWNAPEPPTSQPVPVRIEAGGGNVFQLLVAVLGPLIAPLAHIGIATVLVIFMLLQRDELLDRVRRLAGRDHLHVTSKALGLAGVRVSRYLATQAFINVLHGTVIAIGLELIGVPRALLWGFLAAVLRYLPFIGTWVAAAIPIVLALAMFDDWVRPLLVAGLFLAIDLLSANLLEPWLYGTRTGVAPIAVLVSAIFWTWLWGGIGLFLSTPLTVCLVVIGRHVPQLEFLAVLLSDEPALAATGHSDKRHRTSFRRTE